MNFVDGWSGADESDKYDGTEGNIASKRMFHEAGVKLVQLPYEIDVETKISER